ncbi:uncharacterized protein LOC132274860 [Cornus florida]|uniref:uncharacterized protein LOC132274860 n=1 Tax=Cornus florida TaxID=4283 RepID=UPI0028A24B19|nr:uncharacterized protein LOC132274860 [Cornus florida]
MISRYPTRQTATGDGDNPMMGSGSSRRSSELRQLSPVMRMVLQLRRHRGKLEEGAGRRGGGLCCRGFRPDNGRHIDETKLTDLITAGVHHSRIPPSSPNLRSPHLHLQSNLPRSPSTTPTT